jgi:hypothetical protein
MSNRLEIVIVAVIATLVGLVYYMTHDEHLYDDSADYIVAANSLAERRGFSSRVSDVTPPAWRFANRPAPWKIVLSDDYETIRTPGYPLFLAAMRLLGLTPSGVAIIQHLLRAAMIGAFVIFAASIGVPRPARLAAAAWLIVDPFSLWAANRIITETFFTVVLLVIVWLCADALRRGAIGYGRVTAIGFLLGTATLIRPIAILYFVVVAVCVAIFGGEQRWRKAIALIVVAATLPLLWAVRNERVSGAFTLSTIIASDRLFYRAASAEAIGIPGDFETNLVNLQKVYQQRIRAETAGRPLRTSEKLALYNGMANDILRHHVGGLARVCAHDLRMLLFRVYRCSSCGAARNRAKDALLVLYIAFFAMVMIGVAAMARRNLAVAALLAFTILYFIAVPAGGAGSSGRFRIPVEPYYALMAAYGVFAVVTKVRRA